MVRLLLGLVLLQVCGAASGGAGGEVISPLRPVEPKHLPRFAFGRDHRPIRIPLVVNVFLVNIDYHANNAYTALSATELEAFLMEVLPETQPSCIETGESLHVTYDLWFHVAHIDPNSKVCGALALNPTPFSLPLIPPPSHPDWCGLTAGVSDSKPEVSSHSFNNGI